MNKIFELAGSIVLDSREAIKGLKEVKKESERVSKELKGRNGVTGSTSEVGKSFQKMGKEIKSTSDAVYTDLSNSFLRGMGEIEADTHGASRTISGDLGAAFAIAGAKAKEFGAQAKEGLQEFNDGLEKVDKEFKEKTAGWEILANDLSKIGGTMTKAITAPIVATGTGGVWAYSNFETAMKGVSKTVDMTDEEFKEITESIKNMAEKIPLAQSELAGIAEIAGQLGVSKEGILEFTEIVAMMATSTNMSAEEAAESMARIKNITQMSEEDYSRLGSTVVALGNNMAASESEIINMAQGLASAATQAGLTEAEILALSAGMASVGINAEAGASSMSTILQKINTEVLSSGDRLRDFARISGMTADEFSNAWLNEPQTAIIEFLAGLNEIQNSGGDVANVLTDLGMAGIRETRAIGSLAAAGDLMAESFDLASEAWEENTALTDEATEAWDSFASKVELLKNNFRNLMIELGEELIPLAEDLVELAQEGVTWFRGLDDEVKESIIVLGGLLAVIGPILLVFANLIKAGLFIFEMFSKLKPAIDFLKNAGFGTFIAGVSKAVGVLAATIAALYLSIKEFRHVYESLQETKVGQVILAVFEGIAGGIAGVLDWLENGIDKAHEMVANGIDSLMELFGFEPPWPDFGKSIADVLEAMALPLGDWKLTIERLFDIEISWRDIFGGLLGALEFVEDTIDGWIVGIANKFSFKVPDIISDRGSLSDLIGWNADGGVFTKPTIFNTPRAGLQGVGEAGPEAIIPLNRSVLGDIGAGIASTMRPDNGRTESLLAATLAEMKGMRKEMTNMKVEMDGRAVGGVVTPYVNNNLGREKKFNNNRFR